VDPFAKSFVHDEPRQANLRLTRQASTRVADIDGIHIIVAREHFSPEMGVDISRKVTYRYRNSHGLDNYFYFAETSLDGETRVTDTESPSRTAQSHPQALGSDGWGCAFPENI
jgi:hypothetical protein